MNEPKTKGEVVRTYGDAPEEIHDADGGHLRCLPLRSLDFVVVGVIVSEERLRDRADVVDI